MIGLTRDDIERLAADGRVEHVARRTIVPLDGPTAAIVVDGWFRVFRNAGFVREITLFLAKPGDVLAPGTLFGDRPGESGAEAIADASVLFLAGDAFRAHAEADPALAVRTARTIGHRVGQVQAKLQQLSRATVEARVAATLLEICDDFGVPLPGGGHRIELPLAQEDLARLAGMTRESWSTTLAAFGRAGWVRGSRLRGMVLADGETLSRIAAGTVGSGASTDR